MQAHVRGKIVAKAANEANESTIGPNARSCDSTRSNLSQLAPVCFQLPQGSRTRARCSQSSSQKTRVNRKG